MTKRYTWADYIKAITSNQSELADKVGVRPSTASRWFNGSSRPDGDQVVAVARAYGHSPVGALVAAGYLDEEEVGGGGSGIELPLPLHLRFFSDRELAMEIVRRIDNDEIGEHGDLERPLDRDHPFIQGQPDRQEQRDRDQWEAEQQAEQEERELAQADADAEAELEGREVVAGPWSVGGATEDASQEPMAASKRGEHEAADPEDT